MKHVLMLSLALILAGPSFAQMGGMKGMDMKTE